jgi:hypothetical protein
MKEKLVSFDGKGFYRAEENEYWYNYKIKIKPLRLFWAIIFEKGFLWKLTETIKYALIHSEFYRGRNASDVLLFTNTKNFQKIWRKIKNK